MRDAVLPNVVALVDKFIKFVGDRLSFTPEEVDILQSNLRVVKLRKREFLELPNSSEHKCYYFLAKGIVRVYFHNAVGEEVTTEFYMAPQIFVSSAQSIARKEIRCLLQSLGSTVLLELNHIDLLTLFESTGELDRFWKLLAEIGITSKDEHIYYLMSSSAEEKYFKLVQNRPEYIKFLPVKFLASYLNVSRETLSRIRKNR